MANENCSLVAEELRKCSNALAKIADMLTQDDMAITFVPMEQSTHTDHVSQSGQSAPAVTLADVRSCLAELSRAGLTDKVRELIHAHGAEKLSDVSETEYAALLKEAEDLKHGK